MQGELSEIDVRSILQLIELGQRTGQLLVETYATGITSLPRSLANGRSAQQGLVGQSWYVFFLNGQIVYAGDPSVGLTRLRGYLRRYQAEAALDGVSVSAHSIINAPEYGCLWSLLENRTLMPAQARSILQSMVHETLFDLLSLHQGYFIFEMAAPLTPQLITQPITPLVAQVIKQVQEWKQFYPHLQSPEQNPILVDVTALREALPPATINTLLHYADGQTSLRQIARSLNRDVLTVARAIYPCVQRGWIQFAYGEPRAASPLPATRQPTQGNHPSSLASNPLSSLRPLLPVSPPPRIACLDDAATIRHTVLHLLERHGYEVLTLADPVQAFAELFQWKPDLILCDIAMPELDGYEVCAMLRQATIFRQTPIVMLTGRDGFIDRVRARMAGATDYLAKPFGEDELIMLLEKYIGAIGAVAV
jgi:twitching motility two-component system response regulator PilG